MLTHKLSSEAAAGHDAGSPISMLADNMASAEPAGTRESQNNSLLLEDDQVDFTSPERVFDENEDNQLLKEFGDCTDLIASRIQVAIRMRPL